MTNNNEFEFNSNNSNKLANNVIKKMGSTFKPSLKDRIIVVQSSNSYHSNNPQGLYSQL